MASKYPESEDAFKKRFEGSMATIHDDTINWRLSGSNWKTQHLEALRVVFGGTDEANPKPPFLENECKDQATKVFEKNCTDQKAFQSWGSAYVQREAHKELRQNGGVFGSFFVALTDVLRCDGKPRSMTEDISPSRIRTSTNHPEMVSGEGLSSPTRPSEDSPQGSQIPSSQASYQPEDDTESLCNEDQLELRKHETVARTMASQFISAVIDCFTEQKSDCVRIEFIDEPTRFTLNINEIPCVCEDDGAIVSRIKDKGKWSWRRLECSLEVKPVFGSKDASGKGLVKESVLAQQTCELIGSMTLAGRHTRTSQDDFYTLLSVHQTTLSLLSCQCTSAYQEYISGSVELEQDKAPFLFISKTKDYNLADPEGRREAAILIIALVSYFEDRAEKVQSAGGQEKMEVTGSSPQVT